MKTKEFVGSVNVNFAGRSYKSFVMNASWTIKVPFKMVSSVLDGFTKKKLIMCGDDLEGTLH